MKKRKKKNVVPKIVYFIFAIIVFIAGVYYENGYTDVNSFINDISKKLEEITTKKEHEENINTVPTSAKVYKQVNGKLEMHIIDVGQRR